MRRRFFLVRLAGLSCSGVMGFSGCGTILHQDRIHRPHSRDIDWKVAALNGLGLILFFIPGVVAFVVDFYTGAIYLPPRGSHAHRMTDPNRGPATAEQDADSNVAFRSENGAIRHIQWQRTSRVPPERLDREQIEQVVAENIQHPVNLLESNARVSQLAELREAQRQLLVHVQDSRFGRPAETLFES